MQKFHRALPTILLLAFLVESCVQAKTPEATPPQSSPTPVQRFTFIVPIPLNLFSPDTIITVNLLNARQIQTMESAVPCGASQNLAGTETAQCPPGVTPQEPQYQEFTFPLQGTGSTIKGSTITFSSNQMVKGESFELFIYGQSADHCNQTSTRFEGKVYAPVMTLPDLDWVATQMACLTPTPTGILLPSPTTPATPTPFPPVTPSPITCNSRGEYTGCGDPVLGIEFEYPEVWGQIFTSLKQGQQAGWKYDYTFSNQPAGKFTWSAGGRSTDFLENQEPALTDFRGFADRSAAQYCKFGYSRRCDVVQGEVVFEIFASSGKELCTGGPGANWPVLAVSINVPGEGKINGFRFIAPFLSADMNHQLGDTLGSVAGQGFYLCDEGHQKEYDSMLQKILDSQSYGWADTETAQNVEWMEHLAKSIIVK